ARLDRSGDLALQHAEPALHGPGDLVAKGTGSSVVLDRRGGEEAAAGHHLALVVGEPAVAEGEQPRQPGRLVRDRSPYLLLELLDRGLESRELELLLAAEEA